MSLSPMLAVSQNSKRPVQEVAFNDFLQIVLANNLGYIIEQFEVSAAEAALIASRVYEDPELEMIFPMFDGDEFDGFPRNIAFEMEIPIELFGKRRNRIRQAQAEKFAAGAELDDFLRYLRADAAATFVEALAQQLILERMNLTLEQLNQLIAINQALFEVGEIGEIEVLQTRLEARNFEAELFDERADFSELMAEIWFLMGGIPADSLVFTGDMALQLPLITFDELRERTLSNRADVLAAQRNIEVAESAMRLARSERLPDISLIAGYHNEEALKPLPGVRAAYGGLIIPLKFSGLNRGAFMESVHRFDQSKAVYDATLLEADAGLRSAWEKVQLLSQKRLLFTESILQDAERVRDAVVFSYQRGEVSLLEVLEAQRTLNEIFLNYYETMSQQAISVIELAKESGVWFVEL